MADRTQKGKRRRRKGDFSLKPHVWINKDSYEKKKKKKRTYIEQDSYFINSQAQAQAQARPSLLTIILNREEINNETRGFLDFLSADLDFDDNNGGQARGASIQSARRISSPAYVKVLGPVMGMLCLADDFNVQIYNVTGQAAAAATPWIKSTVFTTRKITGYKPVCEFGFDPDTGKHKVVFVWHGSGPLSRRRKLFQVDTVVEVLTVGVDSRFRIIDAVPPCKPKGNLSAYANGSIYWITHNGNLPFRYNAVKSYSESLMAFDVGSEKFRMISIPKFTISGFHPYPYFRLIELDGCITVVRGLRTERAQTQFMWKFHDRNKEEHNGTISRQDWTRVRIEMPCYISPWKPIYFYPIPGKDQMIIETQDQRANRDVLKRSSFYSYNMINRTFSKFKIQGISSVPEEDCIIYYAIVMEDCNTSEPELS
ncbi:Putative F-box protein At4g38870 [Linum perenne]